VTRRADPALTEAGVAVLSEARSVSVGVDNLRTKVKGLLDGLEATARRASYSRLSPSKLEAEWSHARTGSFSSTRARALHHGVRPPQLRRRPSHHRSAGPAL